MNDGFSGLSSASMSINMGGIATLTYDSGTGGTGANSVDNIVPTAWEEIDYGFATGISDVGAVSASKGVVTLGVKAPVAGTGFSISYISRMGAGHNSDGSTAVGTSGHKGVDVTVDFVDYDAAHAGFRWGMAAQMEMPETHCGKNNHQNNEQTASPATCGDGLKHNPYAGTMYTKLQLGPIHLGIQGMMKNLATSSATAIMNQRSVVTGIAAVFGDTLSLSYGKGWNRNRYNDRNRGMENYAGFAMAGSKDQFLGPEEHEYVTTKYWGYSAALNLGPVALKGTSNHVRSEDVTGIYKIGDNHSELNLSIAF